MVSIPEIGLSSGILDVWTFLLVKFCRFPACLSGEFSWKKSKGNLRNQRFQEVSGNHVAHSSITPHCCPCNQVNYQDQHDENNEKNSDQTLNEAVGEEFSLTNLVNPRVKPE